ncbi:MAG: NfeD family protein [Lachnospiraceae bacterium]|nr:NfeD family protein [Lachnospiraceae bacterium]
MSKYVILWLVILVISIVVEIITMGLTSIWFAGGALIALIAAAVGGPFWLQVLLFLLVSLLLLFVTRPIATKYFNRERKTTNAESLVGEKAVVQEEIDNLKETGKVTVRGMEWTARTKADGETIPAETVVKIEAIQGVKLIVSKEEG